jgi:hypothetical protein
VKPSTTLSMPRQSRSKLWVCYIADIPDGNRYTSLEVTFDFLGGPTGDRSMRLVIRSLIVS